MINVIIYWVYFPFVLCWRLFVELLDKDNWDMLQHTSFLNSRWTITSHSVRLHPLLGKLRHGTNLFSHHIKLAMTHSFYLHIPFHSIVLSFEISLFTVWTAISVLWTEPLSSRLGLKLWWPKLPATRLQPLQTNSSPFRSHPPLSPWAFVMRLFVKSSVWRFFQPYQMISF